MRYKWRCRIYSFCSTVVL